MTIKPQQSRLQLIQGGLSRSFSIAGITIRLSPLERRLPDVDAVVLEQDTGLLLDESAPPQLERESVGHITSSLLEDDFDLPLGSVLPRRGNPLQLDLVVYDLMASPIWDNDTIVQALDELFLLLPPMAIHSLAMPALAHHHGKLPVSAFIDLFCRHLRQHPPQWHGVLWLTIPRTDIAAALAQLEALCDSPHS